MNSITTSLSTHSGELLLILLALLVLSMVLHFQTLTKLNRFQKRWKEILPAERGPDLERMLYDHLRERLASQDEVARLGSRVRELEDKMQTSKRHVGVVRYDAFDDVGGAQSFALAVYDDHGDGAVLNGVIGRNHCRVYCKSLTAGVADRPLSGEENEALKLAAQSVKTTV